MSIRDKIAQQHIDSCLIIDVTECVKADMAQAPKVCWQCGLSFADTILAIEHPSEVIKMCHDKYGGKNGKVANCGFCTAWSFQDGCKHLKIRPATIADLTRIEK